MEKILVIEDHSSVRKNIKQLLEKAGYEVLIAEDGTKGIELAMETLPDAVICDIMMPGISGYEVLRELSGSRKTSSIPFLFLTARAEMADLRLGMELGADDYIIKPFIAGDLLKALRTRLEKRKIIIQDQIENVQNAEKDTILKNSSVIVAGNPPEVLKISEILYISSCEGYTNILTSEGKKVLVRKLLKKWEEILPGEHFLRIHNSTLINLDHIERVEKWFNSSLRIYLHTVSEPLEVSKRYAPKVKGRLKMK